MYHIATEKIFIVSIITFSSFMNQNALLRPSHWFALAALVLIGWGCKDGTTGLGGKDPVPDAKINPEFEKAPPLAQELTLDLLDNPDSNGANAILTATFDEATRRRIGGKYLAMNLAGEERGKNDSIAMSFLRDDGFGGDAAANDGKFSLGFKGANVQALQDFLDKLAATAQDKHNATTFKNRSIVTNKDREKLLEKETIRLGKRIKIKPGIFKLTAPPNPAFLDHSLMITDLTVIEDPTRTYNPCTNAGNPTGPWTFGELMRQLASPNPGAIATDAQTITFISNWLATWNTNQTVNGELLPARSTASLMNTWQTLSNNNGGGGSLKLENVPFRLLAIVNRMDLRGSSGYGFSNAGEGRFVFCALGSGCNALRWTVIFEYGINKTLCVDVKAYAQQWADLAALPFGDPTFNPNLQAITDQFALCGTNPAKPNESSLNQLRTNEIALGNPWELREFKLTGPSLDLMTVKQEPAVKYNAKVNNADVVMLANWVNSNSASILANNYTVPDDIGGTPFLGGKAHTEFPPTGVPAPGSPPTPHHWDGDPTSGSPAQIIDNDTRHVFSLNTCSGCHGGETQTFFTHVTQAPFGTQPPLSEFLTGAVGPPLDDPFNVPDAAGRPSYASPDIRGFNDLWRRAVDLQSLISTPCLSPLIAVKALAKEPIAFTH